MQFVLDDLDVVDVAFSPHWWAQALDGLDHQDGPCQHLMRRVTSEDGAWMNLTFAGEGTRLSLYGLRGPGNVTPFIVEVDGRRSVHSSYAPFLQGQQLLFSASFPSAAQRTVSFITSHPAGQHGVLGVDCVIVDRGPIRRVSQPACSASAFNLMRSQIHANANDMYLQSATIISAKFHVTLVSGFVDCPVGQFQMQFLLALICLSPDASSSSSATVPVSSRSGNGGFIAAYILASVLGLLLLALAAWGILRFRSRRRMRADRAFRGLGTGASSTSPFAVRSSTNPNLTNLPPRKVRLLDPLRQARLGGSQQLALPRASSPPWLPARWRRPSADMDAGPGRSRSSITDSSIEYASRAQADAPAVPPRRWWADDRPPSSDSVSTADASTNPFLVPPVSVRAFAFHDDRHQDAGSDAESESALSGTT
ncbi:hypothetical protein K488DRAFT_86608 [Vararia minispora EC-137]|uniref:Uncharacterized protein n=1 Tax=Vararia minispora EC-137 TaxID=1314806 RepID=A0ACB8QIH1_9AGAM|nr:hypothetical protein K488DRAFT_86608 [Vararia minispora EC-137]